MDSVSVRALEVTLPSAKMREGSIGTCPSPQAHTVPTLPTMHTIFLLRSLKNIFSATVRKPHPGSPCGAAGAIP